MANEPRTLEINQDSGTQTTYVSGGTESAEVGNAPRVLSSQSSSPSQSVNAGQSSASAISNTEERELNRSVEATQTQAGESGTGESVVGTSAREVVTSDEESTNLNFTNERGTPTGNTQERSLSVSQEQSLGGYVVDTNPRGGFERSKGEKVITNTITVDEVKHLIKEMGGSGGGSVDAYTKAETNALLSAKEDIANKVTSINGSSTNTQYPSAKCVYDNLVNVREVAEGKCQTFILSYAYESGADVKTFLQNNPTIKVYDENDADITNDILSGDYDEDLLMNVSFNSQNSAITFQDELFFIVYNAKYYLMPIDTIIKAGDIILVIETDVPDRWIGLTAGTLSAYKLETSKVDLTNYVDLSSAQTITGEKTFTDTLKVKNAFYSPTFDIEVGNGRFDFKYSNVSYLSGDANLLRGLTFIPKFRDAYDLGNSNYYWKDIYFNGKLKDGTYEIAVSEIAKKSLIGDEYSNNSTYAVGDLVIYNNTLYKCNTAITQAEEWDSTHWTATKITSELGGGGSGETEIVDNFDSQLELNNEASLTVYRREFRVSKKGNRVCLWLYYSAYNGTGSSIGSVNIKQKSFEVSSDIAGSLKDMFGNLVSTSDNNKQISVITQEIYNDGNLRVQPMRFYHAGTNKVGLYTGNAENVPNGANYIIKVYTEFVVA